MKTYPSTDRYQRHWFPHPVTGEEQPFTRATTWAKTISDTYGLEMWKNRQVARGVAMREDLQALAAALPDSEKKQLDAVVKQAVDHAAPSAGANVGTALHSWTAQLDRGLDREIPAPWIGDVQAYTATLSKYSVRTIPSLVERYVCMTQPMDVAGQFDRIIEWEGGWYIADVKTSPSLDYSWGEIAVQLALYAKARYLWEGLAPGYWDDMPPVNTEQGLVIHLPAKQAKCELWWVDLELGWKAALLAADVREWRKRKDIARPFGVDLLGKPPVRLVEDPVTGTRVPVVMPIEDSPAADHGQEDSSPRSPHQPVTGSLLPAGDQGKLADV